MKIWQNKNILWFVTFESDRIYAIFQGKTWITASPELYKIVFGDSLFNEHVSTIRWSIKLLEDAFLRGPVLEDLPEIKEAFTTILKLLNRYRFSFEASLENFIKKCVPSLIKTLENCDGNVNKIPAEDSFELLAETYEIMCCDMELLERLNIDDDDLRPRVLATNNKKHNFYYFGWDLIFCTIPIKVDGETQESKPYAVAFSSVSFNYLYSNFITRKRGGKMSQEIQEVSQKMQEYTSLMESRRLPSLRIQKRLLAPSQPVYEPLAHRTRRREKQESLEPTREDILKRQQNDRAARAARREEALALEREKRLKKEPTPPPSVADPVVEVPTMHEDPIDAIIQSVIDKAGQMVKALKRNKRPKSTSQFYNDDTFLPVGDAKYLRVENLTGDVKAEIRKQMNQGREARAEARSDPSSLKGTAPEISLTAAITTVKHNHRVKTPQPVFHPNDDFVNINIKEDIVNAASQPRKPALSQPSKSMILPPSKPMLNRFPLAATATRPPVPSSIVRYRIQRPMLNNGASPGNFQLASGSYPRKIYVRPANSSPGQFVRVIRHNFRYVRDTSGEGYSPAMHAIRSNIPRPSHSTMLAISNATGSSPKIGQPPFMGRMVPNGASRMVMHANGNFRPNVYKQPNTFLSTRTISPQLMSVKPANGVEATMPSHGRTENGTPPNQAMPTLKRFDVASNTEMPNGVKAEVLSTNQSSNQNF